jgi:hypothetical protein
MLAARVETLGVVMKVVGNNAGYTGTQMESFANGVAKMGITTESSREAVVKMASSHMDLNKASGLARIAQDAAVIGNINSSEAFDKMIHGITSGQVEVLRTIGINVQFEASYKKLATQLGKSKDDLTENEKILARTNVVMEKGPDIAGAYSASMDTAGKIINSMKRPADEIALSLGKIFTPALNAGAKDTYGILVNISEALKDNKDELEAVGWWFKYAYHLARSVVLGLVETFYVAELASNQLGKSFAAALYLLQGGSLNKSNPFAGTMKWFDDNITGIQNKLSDTNRSLQKSWNDLATPPKERTDKLGKPGGDDAPGKKQKDDTAAWQAADDKYLEYKKSFEARVVAQAKAARDQENFDNDRSYAEGLVSLAAFIDKKRTILEKELNAELDAAKKNKNSAQDDLKGKTRTGDYSAKEANEYHAALKKVEDTTKSLTEVESKRNIALLKNGVDSEKAVYDDEVRLAGLAEKRRTAERTDLEKGQEFAALRASLAGDSMAGQLISIEREHQAWIDSWATKVGSYEEYQQRLLQIDNVFSDRRAAIKQDAEATAWGNQNTAQQADQTNTKTFIAMQASQGGNETTAGMLLIDKEQQHWEDTWAKKVGSQAEYEERSLQLTTYYEIQRSAVKRKETQFQLGLAASGFNSMSTIADAFYQLSGKKNKTAFKAYQVVKSGETVVSTGSAAMKAYDSMVGIPFVGPGLGVAAAAAAIAAGAVQLQSIWSASPDGGSSSVGTISGGSNGYSGAPGSGYVPQPVTPQQGTQFSVTMHFDGTTLVDEQKLTRWTEDVLLPSMRDLKTRGVSA